MTDYLVVAFGGNAIMTAGQRGTAEEQRANVRRMSVELGGLVERGHRVVITHGNGPQVGEIMLRSEIASGDVPPLTLDVAGAMSQGQIGYLLQQEIRNYLAAKSIDVPVCSMVTQVVVDANDSAFRTPTKPIGRFYSEEAARDLRSSHGWDMVEDAGRGYRRVVPSPQPLEILEWPAVDALVQSGAIVIAAGGGGIPVIRSAHGYEGIEAVIDKDLAAQKLASLVGARTLVLLTEVPAVAIDFATPQQRTLGLVSIDEMKGHYVDGQFPAGSMGPKARAVIQFLEAGGERAIITSVDNLMSAVDDRSIGTQVVGQLPTRGHALPDLPRKGGGALPHLGAEARLRGPALRNQES
jgi:carbamate kinase